jgi:hypothetical protein
LELKIDFTKISKKCFKVIEIMICKKIDNFEKEIENRARSRERVLVSVLAQDGPS